ncbi:hypothetical protein [Streptomyces lydicus]|uniref:hypothetical protein n=1 Tax=Streptomyces lydicus TaxID=47763 RepID=UPI0013E96633|nr:hypothetical protein [Streptomyces lydicus]MCZ1006351.1 hypothetical protein [Streptomyces lydicus]
MDRQQAIEAAARAVIEHGGPECRTDPKGVLDAMNAALDLGASHGDIEAEMKRQREQA